MLAWGLEGGLRSHWRAQWPSAVRQCQPTTVGALGDVPTGAGTGGVITRQVWPLSPGRWPLTLHLGVPGSGRRGGAGVAEGHEGSWATSGEGSRLVPWGGHPWGRGSRTPQVQQGHPGFRSEQPRAWSELGPGEEGRGAWDRSWASPEELGEGWRGDRVGWAGRVPWEQVGRWETGPRLL